MMGQVSMGLWTVPKKGSSPSWAPRCPMCSVVSVAPQALTTSRGLALSSPPSLSSLSGTSHVQGKGSFGERRPPKDPLSPPCPLPRAPSAGWAAMTFGRPGRSPRQGAWEGSSGRRLTR